MQGDQHTPVELCSYRCVAADKGKEANVACVRLSCVVLDIPRC